MGFPHGSDGKESVCNAGDLGLIPRLGRSPQEGNGYPLQYSYLENSMERSLGGYSSCGHKESYMTEQLTFSLLSCLTCKITWQDYGKKFWHWPPHQCPRNKSEEIGFWACIALLPICLRMLMLLHSIFTGMYVSLISWRQKNYHWSITCSAKTKCTHVRIKLAIAFYYAMSFQMFKLDLEKAEEPEDQIANIHWIFKKARVLEKTSTSALLTMPKPLTVWITRSEERRVGKECRSRWSPYH